MEFPAWLVGLALLFLAMPFVQAQLDSTRSRASRDVPTASIDPATPGPDSRQLLDKTDNFIKGLQAFSSQHDYHAKRVIVFCLAGNE
jgi:hypothetical protein